MKNTKREKGQIIKAIYELKANGTFYVDNRVYVFSYEMFDYEHGEGRMVPFVIYL